ncbi:TorF family putative porin [Polynucleobacter sp. HIN5]|uniref:TorF family putative porin n=1 Tax=Polynucleobacter sp. HIN5 TaxID=3047864 RepID=UPI002572E642|nr:TorF family putative porin [Polynucleobacter sp. HIN5]BEI34386.1 TorF family putative porin [Polynucleobacter sp. HIN5]
MNTFKKTTLALAISALAGGAMAQSAPAEEKSPISANVTITNDYRYRGISQTNYQPAIQGGFDYAHESGFYIGNWNSTINWVSNATSNGVQAPLEMDFYGGFKKELIAPGFASDFGVLQYFYPQTGGNYNGMILNPNTTEIYAAQNFTFGPVSGFVKVNYSLTNIFGIPNSSGSFYPDLTVNYDTGIWGITANGHIGYQYIAGQPVSSGPLLQPETNISYTDWKLGLTKDFGGGLALSASYVSTNANPVWWNTFTKGGTSAGRGGAVVALTKTF